MQEKEKKQIDTFTLVKHLIRKSFGDGFLPNLSCIVNKEGTGFQAVDRLEEIGAIRRISSGNVITDMLCPGFFTKQDGSALIVNKKYESQAKKYVELYEKETGKSVYIEFT